MTKKFLEECIRLRKEYDKNCQNAWDETALETVWNEGTNRLWHEYYGTVCAEVGIFQFDLIEGLLKYAIRKDFQVDKVINALKALDIEIEEEEI